MAKKNDLNQGTGTIIGKLKVEPEQIKTEELKSLVNEELNGVLTIESDVFSGTISSKEGLTIAPIENETLQSNIRFGEIEGLSIQTKGYIIGEEECCGKQPSLENTSTQDLFVYKNVINDKMYSLNDAIQSRNPSTTIKEREEFNKLLNVREQINNIVLNRIYESYE